MAYSDSHPVIRDNLVTVTSPAGADEYVRREALEKVLAERDEYRRVLALISAWRLDTGTQDSRLDALLLRIGEDYESARAVRDVVLWARSQPANTEID